MQQWKLLPPTIRWLAITLLILTVTTGSVLAYRALTAEVEVTVEECLSFVGTSSFQVLLYPGESETVQIAIANLSSVDIEIDLIPTAIGIENLTITIPKKITASAKGETTVNIGILASKSTIPGIFTITISFER